MMFLQTMNGHANESNFFSFSGEIQYDFINYYQDSRSGSSLQWNEMKFYPQLKFKGNDTLNFTAEGIFRENLNYKERSDFTAKEAYASIYIGAIDLTLGKQIINWGVADEIKPTDYFKIYDYTDLLRKEAEGILAFRATYYLSRTNVDFVWAPVFESHRISYNQENPWAGIPRQGASFRVNNDHKPARNIGSSQFGLRVGHQAEGVDYSFSYVYGIDRFPTLVEMEPIGLAGNQPIIEILPLYRRIHVFGADWNKSFLTWNFKGEFVYVLTNDSQVDPYFKAVIGGERYFSRLWSDIELFALIQFAIDQTIGDRNQISQQHGIDYNHIFHYAATVNLDIKFSESYSLFIKGIFDMEKKGGVVQSELRWKPRDSLVFYIAADYLYGTEGTYFGFIRDNDRFIAGTRFSF